MSPLLGQPVHPPTINVETTEPAPVLADATGGGGGAASATAVADIPPQERPRQYLLTDADSRVNQLLGRPSLRVTLEPHWRLHPGGVPKEILDGLTRFNSIYAAADRQAIKDAGLDVVPSVATRVAGSTLDFRIEFEVRK